MAGQHKKENGGSDNDISYGDDGKLFDSIAKIHVSNLVCVLTVIVKVDNERGRAASVFTDLRYGSSVLEDFMRKGRR
jgi:hypothetical protein